MVGSAGNLALITKTLVHNGALAAAGQTRLTLSLFLDFCSLCEAAVILDQLRAIESSDVLPRFPMTTALTKARILSEFRPRISRTDLQRLMLRLPEDLSRRLLPTFWEEGVESADLRDASILGRSGEILGINYEQGLGQLLGQLDNIVRYPSLRDEDASPAERIWRSNGYLIVAAVNGMDYYPDFDRAPFSAATISNLYRSLPRQVYGRVAESLQAGATGGKEQLISEWTLNATVPIPPVASLVLQRSRSPEELPTRLLEVRQEFSGYRQHFREFRVKLQAADTPKERRHLQRQYYDLLASASGPDHEIVTVNEMLNFAEKLVPVATAPVAPTSYSAGLITQPAQWLRRWWRQRPLAVLFRLDGKLPRFSEYGALIDRIWGEHISDEVLDEYARHSACLQRIMTAQTR